MRDERRMGHISTYFLGQDIPANVQPHDLRHLTIRAHTTSHEIWLPFMTPDQCTADRIMVEVDRVIQSNDSWLFDDFVINFINATIPVGGGQTLWERRRGEGYVSIYLLLYHLLLLYYIIVILFIIIP